MRSDFSALLRTAFAEFFLHFVGEISKKQSASLLITYLNYLNFLNSLIIVVDLS